MVYNPDCPCKRTKCERHGACTACREHHELKGKHLPACDRIQTKVEKKILREEKRDGRRDDKK